MRDFMDSVTGRSWRVWCRNLSEAGNKTLSFVAGPMDFRELAGPMESTHLTAIGTEITQQWGPLKEQLRQIYLNRFNDTDVSDLKQEAVKRRTEARGHSSYARSRNVNRSYYKPYYMLFQDMVDKQVEIWDSLLELCDSQDSNHLKKVIGLLDECEAIGDEALLWLPELIQRRQQSDIQQIQRTRFRNNVLGIVVAIAVVVAVGAIVYFR